MTRFAAILFVLLVPAFATAETPELSYRFELVREPALQVRIHAEVPGAPAGETTLEVDEQWGGVRAGGVDLSDVTATDATGAPLIVTRPEPWRVVVTHAPGAKIHFSYAISANEHQLQADPGESRRPIVNPRLFQTVGHLALFRPTYIDDELRCTAHLGWDGFDEAGWRVVSSWGVGTTDRTLDVSIMDLSEGLYLAGDIRVITRDVHGYPVTITVAAGDWSFTPDAFADVCERIVSTERGFFNDYTRDFYWISVIPVGPPDQKGRNIGGTGLINCFSLGISPTTPLSTHDGSPDVLVSVIAHEMFHDWNGLLIAREDPEELVYWFSEGFTDFYARRLRLRGGLMDAEQYAVSMNETFDNYFTNPMRAEPNTRIHADFWNDRNVQKLPYFRGDIVAMILDDAIRRKSGGTRSLDDVMRLLADNARNGARVTTESLFDTFAVFVDGATLTTLRDVVENGGVPALDGLFAPCLAVEPSTAHEFDLGFELDPSIKEKKVTGLREGSAAAQAGLREGMALKNWSVRRWDVTQPVILTVLVDGAAREISYYPRGAELPSYRARLAGSRKDCASL